MHSERCPERVTSAIRPYGDAAWLVDCGAGADQAAVQRAARAVEAGRNPAGDGPLGVRDVVVGDRSLLVRLTPASFSADSSTWREWLGWLSRTVELPVPAPNGWSPPGPAAGPPGGTDPLERSIELPVVFDGADLSDVAATVGASTERVVSWLTGAALRVAFLGFSPGFPYLTGLPPPLAELARRPTPRIAVPAGAVAIGGGFAAVYPSSTPGGWHLVGRTTARLFDPSTPPFARLTPGASVRFVETRTGGHLPAATDTAAEGGSTRSVAGQPTMSHTSRWVEVVDPGSLTLIEDAGRTGLAAIGVPDAGPADPDSMVLANRLVGNDDRAAVLECTGYGPVLRVHCPSHLAVVTADGSGVELWVDGLAVPSDAVVPVAAGQTITVGAVRAGARAYAALDGGVEVAPLLGSRSTDVLSGLGPGPLSTGDRFALGTPMRPRGMLLPRRPPVGHTGHPVGSNPDRLRHLRVVPGPHRVGRTLTDRFFATEWQVTADSNRVGLRLRPHRAPEIRFDPPDFGSVPRVRSVGTVLGAVQLPPDAHPIILSVDRATVGGYPVIGCVASADHGHLGQLRPGDRLQFVAVTVEQARRAAVAQRRMLESRLNGWYPTRSTL